MMAPTLEPLTLGSPDSPPPVTHVTSVVRTSTRIVDGTLVVTSDTLLTAS